MRRSRTPRSPGRRGLSYGTLSLVALAWVTGLLTAGVWTLTGTGYGLVTLAVVGAVALAVADEVTKPDDHGPRGRA